MAKAKRPAPKKKRAARKIVNPVTHVKRIVRHPKKKGGKRVVRYSMMMVCPPMICPKDGTKLIADAFGTYRCPKCNGTYTCKSCDA